MRPAFTLIEQLAAVALASLFMLAAMAVLGGVARDRARLGRDATVDLRRVADLLESDLGQARRMKSGSRGVTLSGFGSMDSRMVPSHRPVRVEYRIETNGDVSRLLRLQTSLDVSGNHDTRADWVTDGVARIEVTPIGPKQKPSTQPAADLFDASEGAPVPDVVRLTLTPAAPDGSPFSQLVCLR